MSDKPQTITPYLLYEDVAAALAWLGRAFGFEETLRHTGPDGAVYHAEAWLGDGPVYLGYPGEQYKNPRRLGQETVGIYVLVDDVDAHYERARETGATIVHPLESPWGLPFYVADDIEGNRWQIAGGRPTMG